MKALRYAIISATLLTTSCGSSNLPLGLGGSDDSGDSNSPGEGQTGELITIPVDVEDKEAGLSLATATDFSISVDSCVSGYTTTASAASPNLNVYKFDQGCLAKLTSFTVGTVTYVPTAGDPFSTFAAGDTATFEDSTDPTNLISVSLTSTLDNPISGTETVVYSFTEITEGIANNISASQVSDQHTFSVQGQAAPDFNITSVSFVGITGTGAGQFTFQLTCNLGQSGSDVSATCGDVVLSDIQYKLIEDTFGSSMTISDAATIFATAGQTISTPEVTPNTGFNTLTLNGPDQIALKPNMILILQAGGASYQYFNVDVSSITP